MASVVPGAVRPEALAMELVVFMGLQGSGKSSFFRQRFASSHVLVSKDLWPSTRDKEARQRRVVAEALAAGRSVVVDNTHPEVAARAPLIALGREHGARVVGSFFSSRLEECLARNARRTGRARVPDVALYATLKRLRRPSLTEGFDSLYFVRLAAGGDFVVEAWREDADAGP